MSLKKLLFLDLDNTLICSEDLSESLNSEKISKAREKFRHVRMEDYYDIFERPHLQEFLDFVFTNFRVGVWTAASKDYAIFVVQNFISGSKTRNLTHFFCSHHCNVSKKHYKGVSKDLKLICEKWNIDTEKNVYLVDDLEVLANQKNVVNIKPFFYDKEEAYSDSELLRVKDVLTKLL